jgi:4-amino-4-deoxy-L-arabinose transferase-like glycosyltransferase
VSGGAGLGRVRRQLARVPRAGWLVCVVAFVNAAIWTAVIPPFQVPDETGHFAYAQYVAETGKPPPQGPAPQFSPQEYTALANLFFFDVIGHEQERGVITPAEQSSLQASLATGPSPVGPGGASSITNQPPLYYALAAIPYWLSPSNNILDRLEFMRLLSALLAALTVLATFLFVRELFPSLGWAPIVGGLVVAFQPQFDFISSGVQGDSLLFFASAATFLALIRAYRHGLTRRRAVWIGLATAVGLLGKLTFVAFVPGIAVCLALIVWRSGRGAGFVTRRRASVGAAIAAAVAAVPVGVYGVLNATVWHRGGPTGGGFAGAVTAPLPGHQVVTLRDSLDYTWELFLPKLPFMNHAYFGYSPLRQIFFDGAIGRFGWLDYGFPPWVYTLAQDVFAVLAVLALIGLWRSRRELRAVWPLAIGFGVMALGLLGAIGFAGIRYLVSTGLPFEQARYLFPLLAIYAVFVVLVSRAAPGRWAPALGAGLVILAMTHGLFAELVTVSRYYG